MDGRTNTADRLGEPVRASVELHAVPETMLWTLHNRAAEARRPDARLRDPEAVRIHAAIDYDYERSFGRPDESHAMRSMVFDERLRAWLARHPGGTVVELASGLETQFSRCDDGAVRWLCVDLPEAIAVRDRFLPPTERCRHLAVSAFDTSWMDAVDAREGVFVSAQGLFMYFAEEAVRRLLAGVLRRFDDLELMFDTVPPWFSRWTLAGFAKTKHYVAPAMPWGIASEDIEPFVRGLGSHVRSVEVTPYGALRGPLALYLRLCGPLPFLRQLPPSIVHVRSAAPLRGAPNAKGDRS